MLATALGTAFSAALAGNPTNPILFVTQVPMPNEVNTRIINNSSMSCVSPFSNHLADTGHCGRGGSLHERFSDGQVVDLLALADWSAVAATRPAANTLSVRNPSVNWTATKALFSMVVGAPASATDTTQFLWQLYEITLPTQAQLASGVKPVLTKVANQPPYNNVFPTYGLGGKVLFSSDRPYNGQAHLQQREEYLSLPTVSGLWSLDPSSVSSLQLLHHAPSGAFRPMVDSFGRVVFTNWDHLARDPEAVTDSRPPVTTAPYSETFTQTNNGSGNFTDETASAPFTQVTAMAPNSWDIFPEPRNFDRKTLIDDYADTLNGMALNIFMPWMVNPDGTGGELLNHVGRHEVGPGVARSYKNDTNIVDLSPTTNPNYGGMTTRNYFNNFLSIHEDPLNPGTYYGSDGPDLGTHGAGQIVKLTNAGVTSGGTPQNPDGMRVVYVTAGAKAAKPALIGSVVIATPETLYRTPVALSDGNLVASVMPNVNQADSNVGTSAQPASRYTLRLTSMKLSGSTYVQDVLLTPGITLSTSYYVGSTLVSYNGTAWELDPAEVAPRSQPAASTASVDSIEAGVFASSGVHLPTFQSYLASINAALTVGRNVTKRDMHDRQQPFNLRVSWSGTQTSGASGSVYDVAWLQVLQGDLRRGYLLGKTTPATGRRVVATPLHDTWSENVQTPGAPTGAVRLGDDGSFAVIVPAGKALTWQLLDNTTAKKSQVKERFWVTFQKGEVRTCASCHGVNTSDQTGSVAAPVPAPTNAPQALASLLQYWKANHPAGTVQHTAASGSALKASGSVSLTVSRTGGSTGPVTVAFSTADGTARAGVDYAATSGTLSWANGDTASKTITVPLFNSPGTAQTFSVNLSNPQYGSLGAVSSATITEN
ncbi:hypothetical protein JY651_50205 [Pyxidicoccus parkwayensis]|uniref:Calx-beta domain-containing protein n=1 Tax=Pyxidicoccus parkwayensis TaxID=2813578 RepID=A0ABX7P0G1_9BACT|nr:Calx-beta domain-containing protein [Pyxidicoccus parkwaysis]QSQ23170.1 hypothetical protein JY651_50205 [Pyxidicoccus parkwaysis]